MDTPSHPIHSYFVRLAKLIQDVKRAPTTGEVTVEMLPTPSHLADFGRMLRNCDEMIARAKDRKVTLRPHVKTHKTIEGALLCLFGSDLPNVKLSQFMAQSKIVVSTLGEAKFFADHGFCDILYAAPIVPSKLEKIEAILRGEDAKADFHSPSLISRLSQGQVPGLAFPSILPSSSFGSQSTSAETTSTQTRRSPHQLGVSIALLIDSEFGFQVIKSKLVDNEKQIEAGRRPVLHPLRLWLDVDGGYHRTGLNYAGDSDVSLLLKRMAASFVGESAEFRSATHVHYKSLEEAELNFKLESDSTAISNDHSISSSNDHSISSSNDHSLSSSNDHSSNAISSSQSTSSSTSHSSDPSSGPSSSSQISPIQILLHGLYYHGGNSYGSKSSSEIESYAEKERDAVRGMKEECEAVGLCFGSLAVGSTPTCSQPPSILSPINEFHPGNYIFYDSWQAMIGSCDWEKNASWVLSQVISSYTMPDRIAFDAGALALSKDLGATHVRDQKKELEETRGETKGQTEGPNGKDHHPSSTITTLSSAVIASNLIDPTSPSSLLPDGAHPSAPVDSDPSDPSSSSSSSSSITSKLPLLSNPSSSPSAPMSSHPSPLGPTSSSSAAPAEFGLLTANSDVLYLSRITQEMGIIQVRPELAHRDDIQAHKLMKPGQRFRIIPNHSCLSAACFPSLFIVHGDSVIDEWVTAPRIW